MNLGQFTSHVNGKSYRASDVRIELPKLRTDPLLPLRVFAGLEARFTLNLTAEARRTVMVWALMAQALAEAKRISDGN